MTLIKKVMRKSTPLRATLILVLALLIFKIILVLCSSGLIVDNAHYALYAKYPALSYYDHPPMVGWLQIIPLWISHSDSMQMVLPILFSVFLPLQIYGLTRLLFNKLSPWVAFLAALICQSQVIIVLLSVGYTPQAPFLFFSLVFVYFFWLASRPLNQRLDLWIYTGLFAGLAGLSDYTAAFLVFSSLLYLLIRRPKQFTDHKIYLAAVIALIVVSPVFIWNEQHHWISFTYQLNHGLSSIGWKFKYFLRSQLIQFALYTPLVYILGFYALIKSWFYYKHNDSVLYVLIFVTPVLLLYGYSGGDHVIRAHWLSLAWVLLSVLMAVQLFPLLGNRRWRIYLYIMTGFTAVALIIFLSLVIYPWLPLPYTKQPLRVTYGWKIAANVARQQLQKLPAGSRHLYVSNWHYAGRLAWYSGLPVQVIGNTVFSQYDIWFGKPKSGDNGLVVLPEAESRSFSIGAGQKKAFKACTLTKTVPVYYMHKLVNNFEFFDCKDYQV